MSENLLLLFSECEEVPSAKFIECKRFVHTSCNYTCGANRTVQKMKCNLVGPIKNVTAEWSVKHPCVDIVTSAPTSYTPKVSKAPSG